MRFIADCKENYGISKTEGVRAPFVFLMYNENRARPCVGRCGQSRTPVPTGKGWFERHYGGESEGFLCIFFLD